MSAEPAPSVRLLDDEEELDAWRLRGSPLVPVDCLHCTGGAGQPCSRDRADCSPGTADAERCDPGRAEKLPRHQGTSRPRSGGRRSGWPCPHRLSAAPRHGLAGESSDDEQCVRVVATAVDRPADLGPGSRHPIVRRCVGERGRRPAVMGSGRFWTTEGERDRKSTRLNSSHTVISYAVFCLKKKKINNTNFT